MTREVLVDASTLLSCASILIHGVPPSGIDLLNLASLVETAVLYDGMVVVDTQPGGESTLEAFSDLLSDVGVPVRYEAMSTEEIANELDTARRSAGIDAGAALGVDFFMPLANLDVEINRYFAWLNRVHQMGRGTMPGSIAARARDLDIEPALSLARWASRTGRVASATLFNIWMEGEGAPFREFAAGSLLRTQVYLAAGEILGLPYRPDALRWPIAWRLLSGERRQRLAADHLLQLATMTETKQVELARSLGLVFSLPLPLLLRPVLAAADAPRHVLPEIVGLRYSPQAQSLRGALDAIQEAEAAGDYQAICEDLRSFGLALAMAVGSTNAADTLFAVVGAAGTATAAVADPSLGSLLSAIPVADGHIRKLHSRWKARRFAALTAPLRRNALASESLTDARRVFGNCPSSSELEFVSAPLRWWDA